MEKIDNKDRNTKRRPSPNYGAMEKCKAVLSVWTERRKPAEVCRELTIPWMVFSLWQKRAMEGMLQALEPRVNLDKGPALSPRLQSMLEKQRLSLLATATHGKLENRLSKIQESLRKPETVNPKDEKKT
jgi:hypothetical protein